MKAASRILVGFIAVFLIALIALLGWRFGRSPARTATTEPPATETAVLAASQAHALPTPRVEDRDGVAVRRRETGTQRPSRRSNPAEETPTVRVEGLRLMGAMPAITEESQLEGDMVLEETSPAGTHAPFGRALKCELVFTLESINEETPIIALVTEDVWWEGRLVVPAGTEVHGRSRVDRSRDRILSEQSWVLVLPRAPGAAHGRELRVNGMALDRDQPTGDGLTWGITDGSSGLRGAVIRASDPAELRLIAATFLSAATRSLGETTTTSLGASVPVPGVRNAAVAGTSATLDELAARMLEEVRKSGSYLRVPAGKQFYLYLTQSLNVPSGTTQSP